jgi:hypothetical protein
MQIPPGLANDSTRAGIDTVAINIASINDYVADVDANTKFEPAILGNHSVTPRHFPLYFNGATSGIDRAGKFNESGIAGILTMRPRCSFDFRATSSRQAFKSAKVPSSSPPMRRLYPATSAVRMAASRELAGTVDMAEERAQRPVPPDAHKLLQMAKHRGRHQVGWRAEPAVGVR